MVDPTLDPRWPDVKSAAERGLASITASVPDWTPGWDADNGRPGWHAAFTAAFAAWWDGDVPTEDTDATVGICAARAAANSVVGLCQNDRWEVGSKL